MYNVNFQGLGSLSQRGGSSGAGIEKVKSLLHLLRALQLYMRCSLDHLTLKQTSIFGYQMYGEGTYKISSGVCGSYTHIYHKAFYCRPLPCALV